VPSYVLLLVRLGSVYHGLASCMSSASAESWVVACVVLLVWRDTASFIGRSGGGVGRSGVDAAAGLRCRALVLLAETS